MLKFLFDKLDDKNRQLLAHQYGEKLLTLAIDSTDLDTLKYVAEVILPKRFNDLLYSKNYQFFIQAIKRGKPSLLKYLIGRIPEQEAPALGYMQLRDAVNSITPKENLSMLEYVRETFPKQANILFDLDFIALFIKAIIEGDLKTVNFLKKNFNRKFSDHLNQIADFDNNSLRICCQRQHNPVLLCLARSLSEENKTRIENLLKACLTHGNILPAAILLNKLPSEYSLTLNETQIAHLRKVIDIFGCPHKLTINDKTKLNNVIKDQQQRATVRKYAKIFSSKNGKGIPKDILAKIAAFTADSSIEQHDDLLILAAKYITKKHQYHGFRFFPKNSFSDKMVLDHQQLYLSVFPDEKIKSKDNDNSK